MYVQEAARVHGLQIHVLNASTETEINETFATLRQHQIDALVVASDPVFVAQHDQIVKLVARHAIPAIYSIRELAEAGGLISYSPALLMRIDR
jgi:DNA-binding LacI/PurR family transcriptional regulator